MANIRFLARRGTPAISVCVPGGGQVDHRWPNRTPLTAPGQWGVGGKSDRPVTLPLCELRTDPSVHPGLSLGLLGGQVTSVPTRACQRGLTCMSSFPVAVVCGLANPLLVFCKCSGYTGIERGKVGTEATGRLQGSVGRIAPPESPCCLPGRKFGQDHSREKTIGGRAKAPPLPHV